MSYRPVIVGAVSATETLAGALAEKGHRAIDLTRRLSAGDALQEIVKEVPACRLGRPGRAKVDAMTFSHQAVLKLHITFRDYRSLHVQNTDASTFAGSIAGRLSASGS